MQKKYVLKSTKFNLAFPDSTGLKRIYNKNFSTLMLVLLVFFGVSYSNLFGQVTITKTNITINTFAFQWKLAK